ncbi:hypothetical protein EON65_24215 [archaeon]|nr:MAG: hypothetical protein EON65_24215 [archaeon]
MRSFVPTKEGMSLANPCFVSSVRLTMCDIMCTTNSAHPTHQSNKSRAGSDSILASIPYEKVKSLSGPHKATTKFQKYKGEGVDRLRKDELKRDRREFYTNLFREKEEVNARRKRAATKIQATFRGYRVRPIKNRYIPLKKKIHMYSQFEMQDDLCSLASVLNLPPIPGMSLEARSKASKRKLKIENAAAYILQRLFRMIRQRKMALIVVRTKHAELINRSSRIITRAIRFIITKKFVKRVDIIKREQSAKVVQKYVRRFMARRR